MSLLDVDISNTSYMVLRWFTFVLLLLNLHCYHLSWSIINDSLGGVAIKILSLMNILLTRDTTVYSLNMQWMINRVALEQEKTRVLEFNLHNVICSFMLYSSRREDALEKYLIFRCDMRRNEARVKGIMANFKTTREICYWITSLHVRSLTHSSSDSVDP